MAGVDANLMRDYEAYKDASKEELDEYLSKLPPSKRQAYLDYAARMEAKKAAKEEKKKKENQGQLGCLIAVLVFAGIIGITAYFQEDEEKQAPPAPPKVEQQSKGESKSASVAENSSDNKADNKNDNAKELKKMEIAKWNETTNNHLKAIDEGWKNLWNEVLAAISDSSKDKSKVRQNIEDFSKKLDETKAALKNQKFSEHLTKDEIDRLKEANEDYIVWIEERKDVSENLSELTKGEITPEKLKEIEEALKKSDDKLFKTKSAVEEFQKGMGLLSN